MAGAPTVPSDPYGDPPSAPGAAAAGIGLGDVGPSGPGTVPSALQTLNDWLQGHGLTGVSQTRADTAITPAMVLNAFKSIGIDTNDPDIIELANTPSTITLLEHAATNPAWDQLVLRLQGSYPSVQFDQYGQALAGYGFTGPGAPTFPEVLTPHDTRGGVIPPGFPQPAPNADFVTGPTGALMFRNGVIVGAPGDPSSVVFPADATVQGSPLWFLQAQSSWSQAQIDDWRRRLISNGYLPKGSKGGWDSDFDQAMRSFTATRYANGGRVLPLGPSATGGSTGPAFENLRTIRATIEEQVRSQFQAIYGQDPTPGEIASWTSWAIGVGNSIQRNTKLTPAGAATEAENRALQAMRSSGPGQFQARTDENTKLRDSLIGAAAASAGLMG